MEFYNSFRKVVTFLFRCKELENSIEQLQDEYESTEDYWTQKLEEERSLFDAEQKQNDQKYSELVNKIVEYEEMIKEEAAVKQRLDTIEENDSLEKQVSLVLVLEVFINF